MANNSSLSIDEKRKRQTAYEYLCHLEEAKIWLAHVTQEELPNSAELELYLRNGVVLAKVANFVDPSKFGKHKIYDIDHSRYDQRGLHFKHTDNTNLFLRAMTFIGFPKIFYPETTDIYDMKNMPKVIYCIHALSFFLYKLGKAPLIQNLYGKVEFSEEDIKKVQTALDKYGIQMPAFSKIGGILASELSENEAALHAAILLINEAIDAEDKSLLLERLENFNAQLVRVHADNIDHYMSKLHESKKLKEASVGRKSVESEDDVYDRILTQAEIQGHLNVVNLKIILENISDGLRTGNKSLVESLIFNHDLATNKALIDNKLSYYDYLKSMYDSRIAENKDYILTFDDIEECLVKCNDFCSVTKAIDTFIDKISKSLLSKDIDSFTTALQSVPPNLTVPDVRRKNLNFNCFRREFHRNKENFTHETLSRALKVCDLLCKINTCIDSKSSNDLIKYLEDPVLQLGLVDSVLSNRYLDNMIKKKNKKGASEGLDMCDLILDEIEECVVFVNAEYKAENDLLLKIAKINEVIHSADSDALFKLLSSPEAQLKNVKPENKSIYCEAILKAKKDKETKSGDVNECLWHNEIQEIIDRYNEYASHARITVGESENVNKAVLSGNEKDVYAFLSKDYVGLVDDCKGQYYDSLKGSLSSRSMDSWNGWSVHSFSLPKKVVFYYNHKSSEFVFCSVPEGFVPNTGYLNKDEIQAICNKVTSNYNREKYFKSNESKMVILQSFYRAVVNRLEFLAYMDFRKNKLPHLLVIQSLIKTLNQSTWYNNKVDELKQFPAESFSIKNYAQTLILHLKFIRRLDHYNSNLNNIVALQSLIRASQTLNDYNNLMHQDNPSCKAVCKFVRLLEFDANDLQEERAVSSLLANIYEKIREVGELEQEIKEQDIKIGLLVQSRFNLQDLLSHGRDNIKKSKKVVYGSTISKEKLELREKYGHIFYILQSHPIYPSRLILAMAPNRSNKYTRDICFTMYNYCANVREEFSIIKMLQTAINIEVETKIDTIQEIYKGDPIIITIAVYLFRDVRSQLFIKQILYDPVMTVLSNKYPVNTNPVDIYKQWVNQMETETGQASGMPYDIDTEKALEYEEVRTRIKIAEDNLKVLCAKFVDSIAQSATLLPYGIRCIAKSFADALHNKFPDAPPVEIFKAVGNILYYRLLNPAVVSPDGYKFFDVEKNEITPEQRRNLAAVANVLQKAAASTKFEDEGGHLADLNAFMEETSLKFRNFYKECMNVDEPEQNFNMDEFTDQVSIQKPELRLTCHQVIEIHKCLLEYIDLLCPSESDVLYKAIKRIPTVPRILDLVDVKLPPGQTYTAEEEDDMFGEAVLPLAIIPFVEIEDTEESRMKILFEDTTKMVVDLMHFEVADQLTDILSKKFTPEQESAFMDLQLKRSQFNKDIEKKDSQQSDKKEAEEPSKQKFMTLEETKQKIIENSETLEKAGLIDSSNCYNSIVQAVAKRLINFRDYRMRRKQNMLRLRGIYDNLMIKSDFCSRQKDFYNIYLNSCFENMTKSSKKSKGNKNKIFIKVSASKLHAKGVVLEIEGLNKGQFKNVNFEISSTEDGKVFNVSAKMFGVQMESVDLVFEDLLQQQYNGVSVIKVLDRVSVNVNLLIHLINQKFYSKTK